MTLVVHWQGWIWLAKTTRLTCVPFVPSFWLLLRHSRLHAINDSNLRHPICISRRRAPSSKAVKSW